MGGGKRRLRQLVVSGIEVSPDGNGTPISEMLAGSIAASTPKFDGGDSASTETIEVSITGLTTCHILTMNPDIAVSACVMLQGVAPGADQASLLYGYVGGSGGAAVTAASALMRYIAFLPS